MIKRTAIVAGATGIVGRALLAHLSGSGWSTIGVSRRPAAPGFGTQSIALDLSDRDQCDREIAKLGPVTHIFYSAYAVAASPVEETALNLAMLVNLVTAAERSSPALQHVSIMQGSKWYGNHLGPYRTPAREDDPRHAGPLFYYDQQDWLEQQQRRKRWTWSALRPHAIFGPADGGGMNHLMALAAYACVMRERGEPLCFPGTEAAFNALTQFTDAQLLARATSWVATTPHCANQAYNITNGEPDRWRNVWPFIARYFGMKAGPVKTQCLAEFMPANGELWASLCHRHQLHQTALTGLADWAFADWSYRNGFDQISSLLKIRSAGWSNCLGTEDMLGALFDGLVSARILPPTERSDGQNPSSRKADPNQAWNKCK